MKNYMEQETKSLYREQFEHDNCGIPKEKPETVLES